MAASSGPDIVDSGLVLALDAADRNSYPGSGTTWTDLSGRGNTGTLTNGPTYSSTNGGSIVFDGTNDYVNQSSPSLNLTNFTFSAFIKGSGIIFSSGANEGWPRFFSFKHNRFEFKPVSINGQYIVYTITIPSPITNQWNMVSNVRDGSTMYAFQNGILVNTYNSFPTNNLITYSDWGQFIGREKYDVTGYITERFFTGNIAQVSIYNRALSATEIQQNFNAVRSRFGI